MLAYELQERVEGKCMLVVDGELSFEMFANELPEVPEEKGLLVLNTTPFDIFPDELLEGPEGKHWLALDSPPIDTVP